MFTVSGYFGDGTLSFLRRSNVKVVDVEARGRHSAQRGGDGEEGHSQDVVTACISCCHQEHRRPDHTYRNNTITVKTSSEVVSHTKATNP